MDRLADLVVLGHLAFIVFAVLGGFLCLRWPWMAWLHLPAALWAAAVEILGLPCPLTPLEKALRESGGGAAYEGSFVDRYLLPVVYPARLTREVQVALGAAVAGWNALLYAALLRRVLRRRGGVSGGRRAGGSRPDRGGANG